MSASLLLLAPVRFRLPSLYSLDATFILYHIFLSLSRGFAKVFEVFFVNLAVSFLNLAAFVSLAHSFNIISHPDRNVNTFLRIYAYFSKTADVCAVIAVRDHVYSMYIE